MTSSSGSDDASGHSRRRRSPRSPEPADSSWADVVGVRGSWQDEDPGKNDPPGGFDAFGTRSEVAEAGAAAEPTAASATAPAGPARSDRRSERRDQAASTQQPDAVPGATPASVNPNRPWWAGGGEGGPPRPSSPFQPGSAMTGGMSGGAQPVQPQRPPPPSRPAQPVGRSMFEPAGQEPTPYEPPPYEPTPYETPSYRDPAAEEQGAGGRRTGYDAAPYDPSGYERTEPSQWQPAEEPYRPPSYSAPTYQPPAYEPPAYEPPTREPAFYDLPTYESPARESPVYERPSYDTPSYDTPSYDTSGYDTSGSDTSGSESGGYEPPAYTPPVLEPPRFEHGDLERPSEAAFATPPARMPAPWDSPITGMPSLDEFTSVLPAVPAAPVTPAPIIPAPPVSPAADGGLPRRPVRSRDRSRSGQGTDDDRAAGSGQQETGPETAAEIAEIAAKSGAEPAETSGSGEPARTGREKSFNDVLTGSIPRLGRGRPRSSGRLGAKAKSPGMSPSAALPPVASGPAAASTPAGLDDDTTIFPGLGGPGAPIDEPDATMIRPPLRDLPDQARTGARPDRPDRARTGQPRPGPRNDRPDRDAWDDWDDRGTEGPLGQLGPDDQEPDMLLPGVPGPAPAAGRAGRNLPAAIAVGVGLGTLAVVSLFTRPEAFVAVVSVVAVLAVWELAGAMAAKDIMVPVVPLAVGSLGMLVSAFVASEEGLLVSFTLTGFGVLVWRIIDGVEGAARDITAGLFVAAYVPLLAGFAILMLADGPKYVVVFILVTVASDIGGYAAGVLAGKHPMAPTISPKKTWEGFGGSVLACLGVGVASVVVLLDGNPLVGLALGGATVITATLGDLAESLLKRDLNVKDMGNLLPGHGGLMDRLDSLLPTAPVAFLILHMLVANS